MCGWIDVEDLYGCMISEGYPREGYGRSSIDVAKKQQTYHGKCKGENVSKGTVLRMFWVAMHGRLPNGGE